jgi:hypothetical protein
MTEAEWLACTDPREMLEALQAGGLLPERKARLFAAACCRRIWGLLPEGEWGRGAVELAERFAGGQASEADLEAARTATEAADEVLGWVSLGPRLAAARDPASS